MQKMQEFSSNNFLIFVFSYLVCQINVTPRLFFWRTNSHQHTFIWTTTPLDSPQKNLPTCLFRATCLLHVRVSMIVLNTFPFVFHRYDSHLMPRNKVMIEIIILHRVYFLGRIPPTVFINFLGKFPTTHLFGAPLLFEEFLTDTFI